MGAEQEALRSLLALLDQAESCRQLYERAGMTLPEPLRRILGMGDATATPQPGRPAPGRMTIPPPDGPPRPVDAPADWIWIRAKDSSPTSAVLAVLRASEGAIRARDVVTGVQMIQPDISSGTVANLGSRLEGRKLIERDGRDGWTLKNREQSPIAADGYIWGPASIFSKQEMASHRREAITYLLRRSPGGLQAVQIVEQLRMCPWLRAPANKDLIKGDLDWLEGEKRVRRRGNSRKWELVGEEEKG
jgi:hypothetical protein